MGHKPQKVRGPSTSRKPLLSGREGYEHAPLRIDRAQGSSSRQPLMLLCPVDDRGRPPAEAFADLDRGRSVAGLPPPVDRVLRNPEIGGEVVDAPQILNLGRSAPIRSLIRGPLTAMPKSRGVSSRVWLLPVSWSWRAVTALAGGLRGLGCSSQLLLLVLGTSRRSLSSAEHEKQQRRIRICQ